MTQFHIVGVDLSLSATGIAIVRPGQERLPIRVHTIQSSSIEARPGGIYPETLVRLRNIAARVIRKAREGREEGDVTIAVLEAPIFGNVTDKNGKPISSAGMAHTRAGLWWIVYHLLEKEGHLITVEPKKLKSYVTGNGNAKKDLVFSTIVRNYPAVPILDNNQADALGLAAMAARELGSPIEPSAQRANPGALEGVRWPEFMQHLREGTTP